MSQSFVKDLFSKKKLYLALTNTTGNVHVFSNLEYMNLLNQAGKGEWG